MIYIFDYIIKYCNQDFKGRETGGGYCTKYYVGCNNYKILRGCMAALFLMLKYMVP